MSVSEGSVKLHPALLRMFGPDPERAEAEFADLFDQLRRFMEWRGCAQPEDAAQDTIARGIGRLSSGAEIYARNPKDFFFGIARHVLQEGWKPSREERLEPEEWASRPSGVKAIEAVDTRLTLDSCLSTLKRRDRELLVRYYTEDRDGLAEEMEVPIGQLRLQAHRIRKKVERALNGGRGGKIKFKD